MAKRKNKKIIVKRNRLKGNTATANRKYKDTVFFQMTEKDCIFY